MQPKRCAETLTRPTVLWKHWRMISLVKIRGLYGNGNGMAGIPRSPREIRRYGKRLLREYRGNGNQSWSFPAWKELINAGNAKDLYTVVKVAYCGQVEQGSSWDKGVDGDGEYGT